MYNIYYNIDILNINLWVMWLEKKDTLVNQNDSDWITITQVWTNTLRVNCELDPNKLSKLWEFIREWIPANVILILNEKGININDVEVLRQKLLAKSGWDMSKPEN